MIGNRISRVGAVSAAAVALTSAAPAALAQEEPPPPPNAAAAGTATWASPDAPTPEQFPATTPEIPAGDVPSPEQSRAARSASDCTNLRICAWTGGFFTGPRIEYVAGNSYNWNQPQSSCANSGTSGSIWKNCASSLRNRNAAYSNYAFSGSSGAGAQLFMSPNTSRNQLGVFDNEIESSTSAIV